MNLFFFKSAIFLTSDFSIASILVVKKKNYKKDKSQDQISEQV